MKIGNEVAPPPPVLSQLQEYRNKGLTNGQFVSAWKQRKSKRGDNGGAVLKAEGRGAKADGEVHASGPAESTARGNYRSIGIEPNEVVPCGQICPAELHPKRSGIRASLCRKG